MAPFDASVREARHQARNTVHEAAPWVQGLARLGYAAKGLVYVVIGGLAAQSAYGSGDGVQGSGGALDTVLHQPFGKVLLGIVALGLAGYVLWRVVQVVMDPEHKGGGMKGAGARIGYAISAAAYTALTLEAVRMLRGGAAGQGGGAEHWTGRIMEQPFGRIAVGLAGAGIAAYGLYQVYRGFASDLDKRLALSGSPAGTRRRVVALGRAGTAARGVVFGIIGWMVIQAALRYDASRAQGLQGALSSLREQAYGPWLLMIVALGLIAYGLFQMVKARYRVIRAG